MAASNDIFGEHSTLPLNPKPALFHPFTSLSTTPSSKFESSTFASTSFDRLRRLHAFHSGMLTSIAICIDLIFRPSHSTITPPVPPINATHSPHSTDSHSNLSH